MTGWRCAAVFALVLLTHSKGGLAAAVTVPETGGPPAAAASGPHTQEAPPQVALDVTPADSSIVPLLRAELQALGAEVVGGTEAVPEPVMIQVVLTNESLAVQITDRRAGHATVQETFPVQSGTSMDPRTAVLHVVELLRWHLRFNPGSEIAKPAPVVAAEPKAAPPIAAPQVSNIRIGLTPMAAYSPGGTGLGLGGQIDIFKRWGRFGARALGATVLVPNSMSVPAGSIDVTASWGGLEGLLILGGDRSTTLELGAGGAVFVSSLQGMASGGNVGQADRVITVSPMADVRLRRRITTGFGLTLGSVLLVPRQSSRLLTMENEVGRYGQIIVAFGIGAELTIF